MESPVVIDKPPEYHGNSNERGFPFDEEEGSGAWSELAARHPDIAARLRSRPANWANKRRPSSQDATDEFGDNFSGFDRFPFDDIPPEFREHFPSHWNRRFGSRDEPQTQPASDRPQPQQHQQHHQQQHQHQQQPPHQQTTSTQTDQDPGPSTQSHLPQYGLRNTVDLGQKSPADPSLVDADDRNQRSMSAPPDSCTANQSHTPKMSAQNHQEHQGHPPQHSDHQQQSNVRHIPIFVEGRDEPVINKNVDHGTHFGDTKPQYAPPPPPQPQPHIEREQYFPDDGPVFHPPPNFSRAFGTPFNKGFRQGPQPFVQQKVYPQTGFTRGASPQRSQSPKSQMHPEEHFVKVPVHHEHAAPKPEPQARAPPKQPAQHPQPSQHQQPPQPHQPAAPKQQSPPPQPKPQPCPNDPITQILSIQTDVLNLMTDVENFTGSKKDKRYLYLDEMLTRNLIKLDNIETDGKENIRQARKEAIKCIQKCIAVLEAKAEKGGSTPQPQDVEMKEDGSTVAEDRSTENGVEVEMKDAPAEEKVEEARAVDQQEEKKVEAAPQGETPKAVEPENKAATEPQAADTRPEETKPSETTPEEKNEEVVNKKTSSKKGTKNVKKRDKSKDSKKESKDSNKDQTAEEQKTEAKAEGMQIDDKGDKTETQTMDVDGAASQ